MKESVGLEPLYFHRLAASFETDEMQPRTTCEIDLLAPGCAIVIAPACAVLKMPRCVRIGSLSPKIIDWALIGAERGPRLILLLELDANPEETQTKAATISINPHVSRAALTPISPEMLESPMIAAAVLNLLTTNAATIFPAEGRWARIEDAARQYRLGAVVSEEIPGCCVSVDVANLRLRTIVDPPMLPCGFVFTVSGRHYFVPPVDVALSEADVDGRCLAEIHIEGGRFNASNIQNVIMLAGARAMRIRFTDGFLTERKIKDTAVDR